MKDSCASRTFAAAVLFLAMAAFSGSAFALKPGCSAPPCGGSGGHQPPSGETSPNNLSYPVIFSDNVTPSDWDTSVTSNPATWHFAIFPEQVPSTASCLQETGVAEGTAVSSSTLCYYGRPTVTNDDGTLSFIGDAATDKKVWWLQQRTTNKWQAFNVTAATAGASPVAVSAVDVGDLLESSDVIKAKQVRTEFVLYQDAEITDSPFYQYLPVAGTTCVDTYPTDCLVQLNMSGAVPYTQQSIYETAGTDYGPSTGDQEGTRTLLPSERTVTEQDGTTQLPVNATVYSRCARLIIQKVAGPDEPLVWTYDAAGGSWGPRSLASSPVVDLHAWDDSYSAEINAGGMLLYGYNWNTKNFSEGPGWYRLTFLLEGDTDHGGMCPTPLNTVFDAASQVVNQGERHPGQILTQQALAAKGATRGEGGAVYVEVQLGAGGGGNNRVVR